MIQDVNNPSKKSILDLLTFEGVNIEMFESLIEPKHRYLLEENDLVEKIRIYSLYKDQEAKQIEEINDIKQNESIFSPENFDYHKINLSKQAKEILFKSRPTSLGAATRIPGITPSTIYQLLTYFKKENTHKIRI